MRRTCRDGRCKDALDARERCHSTSVTLQPVADFTSLSMCTRPNRCSFARIAGVANRQARANHCDKASEGYTSRPSPKLTGQKARSFATVCDHRRSIMQKRLPLTPQLTRRLRFQTSAVKVHPSLPLTAAFACFSMMSMRSAQARLDLLEAIAMAGSISAAARAVGMSYKRAWQLVDRAQRQLCAATGLHEQGR